MEESKLQRTELEDLVNLAGGERDSARRLELVVEDRVSSEEKERNGQKEEREREGVWEK